MGTVSLTGVSYTEGRWTTASGRRLCYRSWHPAHGQNAKGAVVIVHGFGEHSGRYQPVAEALAGSGLSVTAPDLWGHGRSAGRRGDAKRFMSYVDDLAGLLTSGQVPGCQEGPAAVYGHSFGALVAVHWTLHHPSSVKRLIVQSPLFGLAFPVPGWKRATARWLGRCWPGVSLPMDLDAGALSHDPEVARAYRADPLVHNRVSARVYQGILEAGQEALESASSLKAPTLLLYGHADRIISVKAATQWYERLTCPKRIVGFAGAYHELHHEAVKPEVLRLVTEWVSAS